MPKIVFLLLCILQVHNLFGNEIDPIFTLQRSFSSAVFKSMGDAGIALPSGLSAGLVNPALINVYRTDVSDIHGTGMVGYGRDSLYNKSIIPTGVSYTAEDGSIALFYRYISSDKHLLHHEITLNLSGIFSPSSGDQGQVDFGVNLRYGFMRQKQKLLASLPLIINNLDSLSKELPDTTFIDPPPMLTGQERQSDLLLDIGFFQPHILPNVDFALTLRNLAGYSWNTYKPHISVARDSLFSDSTIIDSAYYVNNQKKSKRWIHSRYRILAVGIAYHANIKEGSFHLTLPLDIEVLNLFNKKTKTSFVFKGGIEALITNRFALRLGYSRSPGILYKGIREIKNLNFFTGGGGIRIDPVLFDFYITQDSFGTMLSFDY